MEEPSQPFEAQPEEKGPSLQIDAQTIIAGCLIGLLLLVGLMLPPVALGQRVFGFGFQRITGNNPVAEHEGLAVGLSDPDGSLRVKLDSISAAAFNNERAGRQWAEALDALPPTLQLASPVYEIEGRGEPSSSVLLDVVVSEGTAFSGKLDLFAWDSESGKWVFVPHHEDATTNTLRAQVDVLPGALAVFNTRAGAPLLVIVQEPGQSLDPELGAAANILMPAGLRPMVDGALTGDIAAGAVGDFVVMPLVRNYSDPTDVDTATVSAILADTTIQQAHLDAVVNLVVAGGNDGVTLDYRGLTQEQEPAYTAFVSALAELLHIEGKSLGIVLPPPSPGSDAMTWNTAGYNWRALGETADIVEVRPALSPGEHTPSGQGGQVLEWATGEIDRQKMFLGVSTFSIEVGNEVANPINYNRALNRLNPYADPAPSEGSSYEVGQELTFELGGDNIENIGIDPDTGIYRYDLISDATYEVWIITPDKLREQLALGNTFNLAGVVVYDLLNRNNPVGVQQAIVAHKVRAPMITQEPFQVRWAMKNSQGSVIRFDTLGFGELFAWKADEEDAFTLDVSILDPEERSTDEFSFIVGAGPQEEIEAEEEPVVEAPVQPVAPAPAIQAGSAAGGGFELGGQMPLGAGLYSYMSQSGMTWVKYQVRGLGNIGGIQAAVGDGHANGFKVLVSILGEPDIEFDAWTAYFGEIAAQGPDAIEVWNEPNFSREWPSGQLGGGNYVNLMLAPAYNAIKAVDPSIMVISGAPTPTGAFPSCPFDIGELVGCNDDTWIGQVASAGGANFMDCVGVHFNAGTTSPYQNSGGPSGHYSWYFQPMVNVYSAIGRPLCFTELGYVVGPGLPDFFSWGNNTSSEEQAQWLAETATLASQQNVRLMIVWNVGGFGAAVGDPQGAYGMVRDDSTCPACATLGKVMGVQ